MFSFPFHIWDVIRKPLTNSIIFQDGYCTTNQTRHGVGFHPRRSMIWFEISGTTSVPGIGMVNAISNARSVLSEISPWFSWGLPSGYVKIAIENGPVEIVDLPINSMVISHSYVNVSQRVLPRMVVLLIPIVMATINGLSMMITCPSLGLRGMIRFRWKINPLWKTVMEKCGWIFLHVDPQKNEVFILLFGCFFRKFIPLISSWISGKKKTQTQNPSVSPLERS